MHENILLSLSSIILLGIIAQWVGWRMKIPSILILLLAGIVGGPLTGFIQPDALFSDLLFPFVSISVAIILYEGGLSLRRSEIVEVGEVVRNMISIGLLTTWVLAGLASYWILGISVSLSILFGAILVVTGPTVILPLLRSVRPGGKVSSILKWEGMLNDPIGALLAVLVYESILASGFQEITTLAISGILKTVIVGGGVGIVGGFVMMFLLQKRIIPEYLQNSISLGIVILVFILSNIVQKESGLFAVTIMGIFLANQKKVTVTHIIEFKENLRVLLLSTLFIVLSARLTFADLQQLGWQSAVFLLVLIFLIRPAAVFLSTIGTDTTWKERLFVSWMAPRGIVAAAVASLFALELQKAGVPGAEVLVPLTFLVIIATIVIYGLTAKPLTRLLKLTKGEPQGILMIGAHRLAREMGKALKNAGVKVLLVDKNNRNVRKARQAGLNTYHGSAFEESIVDNIDMNTVGQMLALTENNQVNSLAAVYFSDIFGKDKVYQLSLTDDSRAEAEDEVAMDLQGHILFGKSVDYEQLYKWIDGDGEFVTIEITEKTDLAEITADDAMIPMFAVDGEQQVTIITKNGSESVAPGSRLIGLVTGKTAALNRKTASE